LPFGFIHHREEIHIKVPMDVEGAPAFLMEGTGEE
jgi:hypothetical protein